MTVVESQTNWLSAGKSSFCTCDRLAAIVSGHVGSSSGLGIGAYIRDKVDQIRGADDDRSRVEKMRKLDVRIKEVRFGMHPLAWVRLS